MIFKFILYNIFVEINIKNPWSELMLYRIKNTFSRGLKDSKQLNHHKSVSNNKYLRRSLFDKKQLDLFSSWAIC